MTQNFLRSGFFIIISLLFIGLIGCGDSHLLLSHEEIEDAYDDFELYYIPSLMKVATEENRDLKGSSIYYLGLYYRDFLNDLDDLEPEELQAKNDIENFLFDYYDKTTDFNLKNLILMALSTTDHLKAGQKLSSRATNLLLKELTASNQKEVKIYLMNLMRRKFKQNFLNDESINILTDFTWQEIENEDRQIFYTAFKLIRTLSQNSADSKEKLKDQLSNLKASEIFKRFTLQQYLNS